MSRENLTQSRRPALYAFAAFGLAAMFVLSCQPGSDVPKGVPGLLAIEGWTASGEISTYGPDTLYEYINGAADSFLNYGFEGLQVQDFASGDLIVTVSLYDMGDPLEAFGIYRIEAGDSESTLAVGGEALLAPPYQALLVKDRYYVKLEPYQGEFDEVSGEQMLRAVAAAIAGVNGLPEIVQSLPLADQVPGSVRYEKERVFGLIELSRCVCARYRDAAEEEYRAFRLLPEEGDDLESTWASLSEKWTPAEFEGLPVLTREVPYSGIFGVIRTQEGIFGVTDSADAEELNSRMQEFVQN